MNHEETKTEEGIEEVQRIEKHMIEGLGKLMGPASHKKLMNRYLQGNT